MTAPQAPPLRVILLRLKTRIVGRMAAHCNTCGSAGSLRRSARTVGCGDQVRADAAVARQGLRAAGGAPGASRFPGSRSAWLRAWSCAALESARSRGALPKIGGHVRAARFARP